MLTLASAQGDIHWTPQRLAVRLGESPSYLTKVVGHLVRAGILRSERGAKGGVQLTRAPAQVTLLQIVEACQGAVMGDYCRSTPMRRPPCTFHRAAAELHDAILQVLGRWTLADLLESPYSGNAECLMAGVSQPILVQLVKRTKS